MKRSKINAVSKKPHRVKARATLAQSYKALKKRSGGQCEAFVILLDDKDKHMAFRDKNDAYKFIGAFKYVWSIHRCGNNTGPGGHHVLPRSQGGGNELSNLMDLCNYHHLVWLPANTKLAIKGGLLIPYKGYKK